MPMPARTELPAKLAAAEKHIAVWKVHEILGEAKCFFLFGRLVRCRGGCLSWGGAVKRGAQAGVPVPLKNARVREARIGDCAGALRWHQAGMPVLLKPVATIPL
jgi:hypothetical protein